jgi:hypothetical protein
MFCVLVQVIAETDTTNPRSDYAVVYKYLFQKNKNRGMTDQLFGLAPNASPPGGWSTTDTWLVQHILVNRYSML